MAQVAAKVLATVRACEFKIGHTTSLSLNVYCGLGQRLQGFFLAALSSQNGRALKQPSR